MAERDDFSTLGDRVKVLLLNSAIFYAAFILVSDRWLPTGALESVWLLSAFALWFLSLISAPWFVPPRDALTNSIGAICILVTIDLSDVPRFRAELEAIRWASVGYSVLVAMTSLAALFLYDRDKHSSWGRLFFRITSTFGRAELFYTPPALISIIGAYQINFYGHGVARITLDHVYCRATRRENRQPGSPMEG